MNRHALLAVAAGLVSLAAAGDRATATTAPPDDGATDFIHKQAEAAAVTYFLAIDPGATQVACGRPAQDSPGQQFLCYAYSSEGQVLVAQVTINDYGTPELADFGAGGPVAPTVPPSSAPNPTLASFQGSGNALQAVDPITATTIIHVTHDGAGAFSIQPQQGGVAAGEPLLSGTGAWDGRYLVGLGGTISAFAITADGNWTLEIQTVASVRTLSASEPAVSMSIPDVVSYADSADVPVTVDYTGTGPIVVRAVSGAGTTVLVNEPGAFNGEVTLPAGPGFVTVEAFGSWSLTYPAGAVTTTAAPTTASPTTAAGTTAAPTTLAATSTTAP